MLARRSSSSHSRPGGLERLVADAQSVDDLLVAEFCDLPNHGQGTHGELAASRYADLAYQDHSESSVQPGGHLGADGYPPRGSASTTGFSTTASVTSASASARPATVRLA